MGYAPEDLTIAGTPGGGVPGQTTNSQPVSDFSIIILTFQRPNELLETVGSLREVALAGARIIVVDNGASPGLADSLNEILRSVEVVSPGKNLGVGGRNVGLRLVRTRYVVTLDDDVRGITLTDLTVIRNTFEQDHQIGALCFRVVDATDPNVTINWCHHRAVERFWDEEFITDEITEGAVAFRAEAIFRTELYPEDFFISHEGPALAIQLMNQGYRVWYSPRIVVRHCTAPEGRQHWRRYYYDTRNVIWLAVRYLPLGRGLATSIRGIGGMFLYSARDSNIHFWIKGCLDGIAGIRDQFRKRIPPNKTTRAILRDLDRARPTLLYLLRRRLFQRGVRI